DVDREAERLAARDRRRGENRAAGGVALHRPEEEGILGIGRRDRRAVVDRDAGTYRGPTRAALPADALAGGEAGWGGVDPVRVDVVDAGRLGTVVRPVRDGDRGLLGSGQRAGRRGGNRVLALHVEPVHRRRAPRRTVDPRGVAGAWQELGVD